VGLPPSDEDSADPVAALAEAVRTCRYTTELTVRIVLRLPRADERAHFFARPVFARTSKPPEQLAVIVGRYKAIVRPGGAVALSDLEAPLLSATSPRDYDVGGSG
jgi:hypothetical protein